MERMKSHAYLLVKRALSASFMVGSPSIFSSRNCLVAAKIMKMMIPITARSTIARYISAKSAVKTAASGCAVRNSCDTSTLGLTVSNFWESVVTTTDDIMLMSI